MEIGSRFRTPGRFIDMCAELSYRAPFQGEGLIGFLGSRSVPGVEEVLGGAYRRSLRLANGAGVVELRPANGHVEARFALDSPADLPAAKCAVRGLLDLDHDPGPVVDALGGDPVLGGLVRAAPGRRVPGHVDPHELAVRAVLGQQVSLAAAVTIAGRLVATRGERLASPVGSVTHLFPSAAALAGADPAELPMPRARGRALIGLCAALANGELVLGAGADREQARERMLALPGVGPWTAGYIEMRALGDPDAFMPTDLGLRRGLERLGHDGRPPAASELAERWRPYRAYALQYVWADLAGAEAAATLANTDHGG